MCHTTRTLAWNSHLSKTGCLVWFYALPKRRFAGRSLCHASGGFADASDWMKKVFILTNFFSTPSHITHFLLHIQEDKIKAQMRLYLQHPKITKLISIHFKMLTEEQAELARKFLISNESKLIQEKLGWYAIMYIILSLSLSII